MTGRDRHRHEVAEPPGTRAAGVVAKAKVAESTQAYHSPWSCFADNVDTKTTMETAESRSREGEGGRTGMRWGCFIVRCPPVVAVIAIFSSVGNAQKIHTYVPMYLCTYVPSYCTYCTYEVRTSLDGTTFPVQSKHQSPTRVAETRRSRPSRRSAASRLPLCQK